MSPQEALNHLSCRGARVLPIGIVFAERMTRNIEACDRDLLKLTFLEQMTRKSYTGAYQSMTEEIVQAQGWTEAIFF